MTVPSPRQSFPGRILPVTLPAGEGGTPVTVGGQNALHLAPEGEKPNGAAFGMEVRTGGGDLPSSLAKAYEGGITDPAAFAKRCAEDWKAQFIFLALDGCHPDCGGQPAEEGARIVREVLSAVSCPVIVGGCGEEGTDAALFPAIAEAATRPVFLSYADEKNYRLVGGAALAYGHGVVAWSPIDINMAKQANLLLSDIGVPPERILIDPLTGGLGYGLEYTYSIVERIRLAGLSGDAMLARPVLCHLGDAWKAREAVDASEVTWGDAVVRGRRWEEATGWACLAAGADLLVFRHPDNVQAFREAAWR
ncbi:MAG: acetyl-CoA decarbonylase/synthase complex subunit delta [Deltaproteobacteria bacterium]|nr:acetyl-CoA decarbonylase/synthase complex subunit delta [Deltaproteobacteria bacterium]